MKPVEQMTCEELENELADLIKDEMDNLLGFTRSIELLAQLKSRRLAAGAG